MKKCFINGIGSVSAASASENRAERAQNVIFAQHPSYKERISPAMIRRMATGVKMGIFAAHQALEEASIECPEAILAGTGMGCLQDSEKFLKAIIENQEQFLTPTSFIQSTHNTVTAQIALQLQCKGYNFTYVNGGNSFENALLDGLMQIQTEEVASILVGGVDEISEVSMGFLKLIHRIKNETDKIDFHEPTTEGVPFGEGATFFVLSDEKNHHSYAEVVDVWVQNTLESDEIFSFISSFLEKNNCTIDAIDALVVGCNADRNQHHFFKEVLHTIPEAVPLYYKHRTGEFDTASAYGMKIGAELLKNQTIDSVYQWNIVEKKDIEYVLLFNSYFNSDFSFVLLKKC